VEGLISRVNIGDVALAARSLDRYAGEESCGTRSVPPAAYDRDGSSASGNFAERPICGRPPSQ